MQALIPRLLAAVVLPCCVQLHAAPLDAALDESQRLAAEAKASQARIEQLDDASRQMRNDYRRAVQLAEPLHASNEQVPALPAGQRPLRTVVGRIYTAGVAEYNEAYEGTRERLLEAMGRPDQATPWVWGG